MLRRDQATKAQASYLPVSEQPTTQASEETVSHASQSQQEKSATRNRRVAWVGAFLLLLGLFASFVWPTPYEYARHRGHWGTRADRRNRMTGAFEAHDKDGTWHTVEQDQASTSTAPE